MLVNSIAVICYSTSGGGAERATLMWVKNMLKQGKSVLWIYTANVGYRQILHPCLSYEHLALDANRQENLRKLLQQYKIDFCYEINPDDVELLDDINTIKSCGVFVGVADHSCYFYPLYTVRPNVYLKRIDALQKADVVTALSPENVEWFLADGVKHTIHMPNYLTFDPDVIRCEKAKNESKELLFVGRLCNLKSPHRLLKVVAELKKDISYADVHLTLLGRFENSEVEDELRGLVKDLSISDNISFLGEVVDVEQYFQKAKLLLVASYIEGAPMVINEAKAYGVPTIMFSLPYVPGTNESEGVVSVPQDDISAMVARIKQCFEDNVYYEKLSVASRESLELLSNKVIDERWNDVFAKLENGIEIGEASKDNGLMFATTMDLVRLVARQVSGLLSLYNSDKRTQCLLDEVNRMNRKNIKHLMLCRYLIAYSILVTTLLVIQYFLL